MSINWRSGNDNANMDVSALLKCKMDKNHEIKKRENTLTSGGGIDGG